MYALAIVNPISGRGNVAKLVESVRRELAAADCRLDVVQTTQAGDARRIAARALDDARAVIAVGGDGTVHEVAAGLVGREAPLAVLPAGTENIVARHFRVPRRPPQFADMIVRGATTRHDVGLVNGEPFMIMCGVGFDARVVELLSEARTGHIGYRHYIAPLWRTLGDKPFPLLVVEADGARIFEGRGMAFVGVAPRYSIGLSILARAVHDDGFLDVCVFPAEGTLSLLGHALRTLLRRHIERGGTVYRKCRALSISSPERVPIQCDGDPAGTLPARFEVLPGAIKMIVPRRIQNSEFRIQNEPS